MCRTIVGYPALISVSGPGRKNLHSSVSSQFAEGIRQAGGLLWLLMGDPLAQLGLC